MVPDAASRPGFGNPRRRWDGAWHGSAAVVEFSGTLDAGDGFDPDPDATGKHEAGDRRAAPACACVLGRSDEPTKLHVHVFWLYGRLADRDRLRDLDRSARKEFAEGTGPGEADGGRRRADPKIASWPSLRS